MSDIPIGSPPVPPGRHAAPGGWYPDPVDPVQERYWDGWQWSRTTRLRDDIGKGVEADYRHGAAGPAGGHQGGPGPGSPAQGSPAQGSPAPGSPAQDGQPRHDQRQSPRAQDPLGLNSGVDPGPDARPAPFGGMPQATRTADGVPLAGWWWRLLAVYLDSIVVGTLALIAGFSIYQRLIATMQVWSGQLQQAAREGRTDIPPLPVDLISRQDQLTLTLIQLTVALVYNIGFLRWRGATPGKMICRLRVVPLDEGRSTQPLAWGAVVRRSLVWVLPSASPYLLLIRLFDGALPLWQPKRQALHDLAARTQVVKLR